NNIGFITGGIINAGDSKDDAIYKTTDGGNSWYEVLNQYNQPASWGIYDIVMVKDKYGIATSKTGLVYNSTDQGETWEFDILNQVEKSIFPSYLMSKNKTCYMILPKQGLLSYDENLFGITSVPVYNYKSLSVYPNPVKSELNFYDNNSIQGLYNLKIFSADSKLVIDKKVFIENGFRINIDLPSGTYYLLLEGDEYFFTKIIKE
ncbi:MAG: T9SS type A sorting domain-containing protein, partial [Candidatus Kapaibacterium sp.]